jgi:probable HAF family extracellular repeat protein
MLHEKYRLKCNAATADGTVVVGHANDATGILQGFRWTAASGMVGLGFFAGR